MAKRVNTRFLTILTIVVVGLGAGLFAFAKFATRHDPSKLVAAGDRAFQEGRYENAADNYRRAVLMARSDKELRLKWGDALYRIPTKDSELMSGARGAWFNALEIDPKYPRAMERLLDTFWAEIEMAPTPMGFKRTAEMGQRLSEVEPANTNAAARWHIATIRQWLSGIPTKAEQLDKSLKSLAAIHDKAPADPTVLFYLAQSRLKQALDKRRQPGGEAEANQIIGQTAKMVDKAVAADPKNPELQLRAYQLYMTLSQIDARPDDESGPAAKRYEQRLADALVAAQNATPDNPRYFDIRMVAIGEKLQHNKLVEADKILLQLIEDLKGKPDEQRARYTYGRVMGKQPQYREKAIQVLEQGGSGPGEAAGIQVLQVKENEARALLELTSLRADFFLEPSTEVAKRKQLKEQIDEGHKRLKSMVASDFYDMIKLTGKVQLVNNRIRESIASYNRAWELTRASSEPDYELGLVLARLFTAAGQTGQAREILQDVVKQFPNYVPGRMNLARVLLQEGKKEEAQAQVEVLKKLVAANAPQYPELVAISGQLAGGTALETASGFKELPETSVQQRLVKSAVASGIKNYGEAIRLSSSVLVEEPKNLTASQNLVNAYMALNQKEKAREVLQQAAKLYPDNRDIANVLEQLKLNDASPEQLYTLRKAQLEKEPDAFNREIQLADLEVQFNHIDQATKHINAAARIKPTDSAVALRQFEVALNQRQWEQAEKSLDLLVKGNADQFGGLSFQFQYQMARTDFPQAVKTARELTTKWGQFAVSWVDLGKSLQASNRFAEAIEAYQAALERQGRNYEAIKGLIDSHIALNQPDQAKRFIDQGTKLFPGDSVFRELSLNHQLAYGDPEPVVVEREAQLKKLPENPRSYVDLASACVRAAQSKGSGSPRYGELLGRAREVLTQALAKFPEQQSLYAVMSQLLQLQKEPQTEEKLLREFAARPEQKGKPDGALLLAGFYNRSSKPDLAEQNLREALAKSNNSIEVRQRLAAFLNSQKKYDDALQVLSAGGNEPRLARQRVEILLSAKRNADAEKAVRELLAKSPQSADLLLLLANTYANDAKYDLAAEALKKILDSDPNNEDALYNTAVIKLRQGDAKAAADVLGKVVARDPRNARAQNLLADATSSFNLSGAIAALGKAVEENPNNIPLRLKLMDFYASTTPPSWDDVVRLADDALSNSRLSFDPAWNRSKAAVYANRNDFPKAYAEIQQAMKLAPTNRALTRQYYELLVRGKEHQKLLSESEPIVAEGKAEPWVYQLRGTAKASLKDSGALAEFDKALAGIDPKQDVNGADTILRAIVNSLGHKEAIVRVQKWAQEDPRWLLRIMVLYQESGDWTNALQSAEALQKQMDKLEPADQLLAMKQVAIFYQVAQPTPNPEKAVELYREVVKRAPNDFQALNNLAYLLIDEIKSPDPRAAREFSQRAFDLVRNTPQNSAGIRDTHAWVLIHGSAADVSQGVSILKDIAQTSPFPEAYYHLAEGFLRQSNPQEAQKALKSAVMMIDQQKKENKKLVNAVIEEKVRNLLAKTQGTAVKTEAGVQ